MLLPKIKETVSCTKETTEEGFFIVGLGGTVFFVEGITSFFVSVRGSVEVEEVVVEEEMISSVRILPGAGRFIVGQVTNSQRGPLLVTLLPSGQIMVSFGHDEGKVSDSF